MITTRKTLLGTAIAVALTPIAAQSASFGLNSHSARSGGTSHAGTAVMAEDPATVFYNPAGMVLIDKAAVSGSFAQIMPEFEFTNENSNVNGALPLQGDSTSDETGLAPSFYYMTPFRDDWALGISINTPYGLTTDYGNEWAGRYHATESDIRGININPNIAYQINDMVSIGFGINAQYFDATLTKMTPSQGLAVQDGNNPANPQAFAQALFSGEYDTQSEVEGDSWAAGYNIGVLVQPADSTRIGLAYRSKVSHDIDGDLSFDPVNPQNAAGPTKIDATASIELPESATLSISQELGEEDRLTLLADAQYTRWSRVERISIQNAANNQELTALNLDFQNSWRGSVGAAWEQTDQLTLRAGYTFEESAVRSAETRTPRVPDNHRNWVSVGAGYAFADGLELDASYSHLFIKDTSINNTENLNQTTQATLNGEYESSADILSVQATYRY